jgi:hypothetical protein
MAAASTSSLRDAVKLFDALALRRSPALEYSFAWLKKNLPKGSAQPSEDWSTVLASAHQAIESFAQASELRSGKALLGASSMDGALLAQEQCLTVIATSMKGSVQAVLAENDEKDEEPKRKKKVDEDDDDDEDEGKESGALSAAESLEAMQRFLQQKLGAEHEVTAALSAAIGPLIEESVNGGVIEAKEVDSLSRLLGHPTTKNCWKCGAVVGQQLDLSECLKLRSELCSLLREGRAPLTKPGLLKHLLIINSERLKLASSVPRSKL